MSSEDPNRKCTHWTIQVAWKHFLLEVKTLCASQCGCSTWEKPSCIWIANLEGTTREIKLIAKHILKTLCNLYLPWPPYISASVSNTFGICCFITVYGTASSHFVGTLYPLGPTLVSFCSSTIYRGRRVAHTIQWIPVNQHKAWRRSDLQSQVPNCPDLGSVSGSSNLTFLISSWFFPTYPPKPWAWNIATVTRMGIILTLVSCSPIFYAYFIIPLSIKCNFC